MTAPDLSLLADLFASSWSANADLPASTRIEAALAVVLERAALDAGDRRRPARAVNHLRRSTAGQQLVARYAAARGLDVAEMVGRSKEYRLVQARAEAAWLLADAGLACREIGRTLEVTCSAASKGVRKVAAQVAARPALGRELRAQVGLAQVERPTLALVAGERRAA